MFKKISAPIALLAASLLTGTVASASDDYIINTASTGGTYHPVGTAIATLSKIKLLPKEKFSLTAVNSAGSGANVQALAADTAQFAIVQGLFGSYAATGTGPVTEKQENMRSITMLWQNVEQFILQRSCQRWNGFRHDRSQRRINGDGQRELRNSWFKRGVNERPWCRPGRVHSDARRVWSVC